eukprot:6199168-Pleurochrysis_carterae.AAC.2
MKWVGSGSIERGANSRPSAHWHMQGWQHWKLVRVSLSLRSGVRRARGVLALSNSSALHLFKLELRISRGLDQLHLVGLLVI